MNHFDIFLWKQRIWIESSLLRRCNDWAPEEFFTSPHAYPVTITWKLPQTIWLQWPKNSKRKWKLRVLLTASQQRQEHCRHTHTQPNWKQTKTFKKNKSREINETRNGRSFLSTIILMSCACDHFTLFLYTFSLRSEFYSVLRFAVFSVLRWAHSSARAHISWPLEIRYLPGSSRRMRCLRMRERAACLCYLTTAYRGKDVTQDEFLSFGLQWISM